MPHRLSIDTVAVAALVTVDNFGVPSGLARAISTHLDLSGYPRAPEVPALTVDGVEM